VSQEIEFVGVILLNRQGCVALQLREPDRELNPDLWSVFGGHIEIGEQPEKAAIREVKEELNVVLSPEKLKSLGRFVRKDHAYNIFIYPVSHELDKAELKEGRSWRWCQPQEIQEGVVEGKKIVDYHARFLLQFLEGRSSGKS
jgi:8-oxo-dGTP pyrophosphatase MutT (NUDIX family)